MFQEDRDLIPGKSVEGWGWHKPIDFPHYCHCHPEVRQLLLLPPRSQLTCRLSQPWTWWQDTGRLNPTTTASTFPSDLLASIHSNKMPFVLPLSCKFCMNASNWWSLICNKSLSYKDNLRNVVCSFPGTKQKIDEMEGERLNLNIFHKDIAQGVAYSKW